MVEGETIVTNKAGWPTSVPCDRPLPKGLKKEKAEWLKPGVWRAS
ncbi:hypothetical protein [Mesorhizobium sp. B1-1-8]|nr:hypothetical protein [Mesorhizobium sp. B1-1-8]